MNTPAWDVREEPSALFSLLAVALPLVPKRSLCLAILLLAVGAAGSASATNWVLTAQGWRQPAELLALPARPAPRLHPLVLAGFQVTASAFALLALSPGKPLQNRA